MLRIRRFHDDYCSQVAWRLWNGRDGFGFGELGCHRRKFVGHGLGEGGAIVFAGALVERFFCEGSAFAYDAQAEMNRRAVWLIDDAGGERVRRAIGDVVEIDDSGLAGLGAAGRGITDGAQAFADGGGKRERVFIIVVVAGEVEELGLDCSEGDP